MHRTIISLGIAAVVFLGCTSRTSISEGVSEAIRKGETVDLAKLAHFEWDSAYVFSPYSAREQVCSELPPSWSDCRSTLPKYIGEGDFLTVFVKDGLVVHQELHSRRNGDYCAAGCALKFPVSKARFQAIPSGQLANGDAHYVLVQLP